MSKEKKIYTRQTLGLYWLQIKQHVGKTTVVILCVMAASAISVTLPLYFKNFFDALVTPAPGGEASSQLLGILIIIAGLELLRWALWRIEFFVNAIFQTRIMADLAAYCFQYLHRHSFSYFNNNFVGSLVKRVNWFTRAFESLADKVIFNFLPLLINLIIILVVLFQRHLWLGLGTLIWVVLFLSANWFLTRYKLKYDLERSAAETKATGVLADTITNNSNVKLFNGYQREIERFGAAIEKVRSLRFFTWTLDNIFDGIQGLLTIGLEIGIFYIAIGLWRQGILSVGDFVLLQSYVIILFEKVWDFGRIIRHAYTDLADASEMTLVLTIPHEIQDVHRAQPLTIMAGAIEFKNVDFYYHETRPILKKLNLSIESREKVALVGPSGAGKSTIVKLLLREHDITGGKILIDDQRISHVTQESLWSAVSLVPQEPILFHRTLLENISYGKSQASKKEIISAARQAHCHEFIESFPDKYGTYVGERGVKLSGGERQRVAIARAILRNAPILVLDEATSSLDSESEHLIQDALHTLMANKTVIVIAHRLSTIMAMDRIVVVDNGKIIQQGTHAELLAARGLYSALWQRQVGGFLA